MAHLNKGEELIDLKVSLKTAQEFASPLLLVCWPGQSDLCTYKPGVKAGNFWQLALGGRTGRPLSVCWRVERVGDRHLFCVTGHMSMSPSQGQEEQIIQEKRECRASTR